MNFTHLDQFIDEEERARIEWLRGAAHEGFDALDRGLGTAFSPDELDAYIDKTGEEVLAEEHRLSTY